MAKKNSIFKEIGLELSLQGRNFINFFKDRNNIILLIGILTTVAMWGIFMYNSVRYDNSEMWNIAMSRCRVLTNERIITFIGILVAFMISTMFCLGEFLNYSKQKVASNKKQLLVNSIASFCTSFSIMGSGLILAFKWC